MRGGGGPISRHGALSTACGRFVLAPAGPALRVYSTTESEPSTSTSTAAVVDGRSALDASCSAGVLVSEMLGHEADVTAVSRNPENDEQVYTASLDGTVRLWAWATGECLDAINVGVPITGLAVPPRTSLAYLSTSWADGTAGRIMRLRLSSKQLEPERFKLSAAGGRLALSAGGGVVVAAERRTLWAWRAAAPSLRRPLTLTISKSISSVAVDGDDDRLAVGDATGRINVWRGLASALSAAAAAAAASANATSTPERQHRRGQEPPPPTSKLLPPLTLHWHSSSVRALCFSADGELLLSGGDEGVLCWWRLAACAATVAGGGSKTAARGFLPRLGGPISSIDAASSSSSFEGSCVVSQADNTIRKINLATVDVEASVHGLRPKRRSNPFKTSAVDPFEAASPTAALCPLRSAPGDLVVAGNGSGGSSLQFWSSARDAHAASLAVSRRNDVAVSNSSGSSSSESSAPRITGLAFSGDGRGLATAEEVPRPGAGVVAPSSAPSAPPPLAGRAGVLKLWAASASQVSGEPPYALVAEVVEPHRGPIAALAYSPRGDAVATTGGEDGELKLWSRKGATASPAASPPPPSTEDRWRCSWSAGLRSAPLTAVAFSRDGSLVAAAASSGASSPVAVGLWRVDGGERVAVLAPPLPPSSASAVSCLAFVPGTATLVAALSGGSGGSSSLVAWDLLTKTATWAAPLGGGSGSDGRAAAPVVATRLAASPSGGLVAVSLSSPTPASGGGRVLTLRSSDGAAVSAWDLPRSPADALLFEPSSNELLILTADREYAVVDAEGKEEGEGAVSKGEAAAAAATKPRPSAFESIFGGKDPAAAAAAAAPATPDRAAAAAGRVGASDSAPWASLFDAPSHALPAPRALASKFFDALLLPSTS